MTLYSRRLALGSLGGAILGAAALTLAQADETSAKPQPALKAGPAPAPQTLWTPHPLEAAACQPVAYDGYWLKGYGCCYGVFTSIIETLGKKYGAPYNQFPFFMMEVGKSGISEWGTICGALLGAASAFALFWGREQRDPMVTELFRWYENATLPVYDPGEAAQGVKGPMPTNVSHSVLCHISVSAWSYATGIDAGSQKRSERCARITADVAAKAVEIMNAKIEGTLAAGAKPKSVSACGACHDKGGSSPILKGKMDCTPCHSGSPHTQNKFANHP